MMTDRKSNSQFCIFVSSLTKRFVIHRIHLKCHPFSVLLCLLSPCLVQFSLNFFTRFFPCHFQKRERKKSIRQFDVIVFDFMSGKFQRFFSLVSFYLFRCRVSFRSAYLKHETASKYFFPSIRWEDNIQQINDIGFVVKIRTMQCQTKYELLCKKNIKYGRRMRKSEQEKCRRLFAFPINALHEKWERGSKPSNIIRLQQIIVFSVALEPEFVYEKWLSFRFETIRCSLFSSHKGLPGRSFEI